MIAHSEGGAEAGLVLGDGAGSFGDGEEVDADLVDLALFFAGSGAGVLSWLSIHRADLFDESGQAESIPRSFSGDEGQQKD